MEPPTLVPLEGGWSGETFVGEVAGQRSVVRIYGARSATRGPWAPEVDAAVLGLVRGLLPVPQVLEVRRARPEAGEPALLVTSLEPGVRGDLLLPGLGEDDLARAGSSLGTLAARLACMPMLRPGPFVDPELRIGAFGDDEHADAVVASHPEAFAHWTTDDRAGLEGVLEHADVVARQTARSSLVHGDLNAKNVLLDPDTLEVTALVDWEFAHAGHPRSDLGNLLRFDRQPAYVEAVLAAYRAHVPLVDPQEVDGESVDQLLTSARGADLVALVHLAVRRGTNPVADRAHDLLRAMARAGDLLAEP